MRYSPERMYLLGFEREMEYIFTGDERDYEHGLYELSITDPELSVVESSDGRYFAFACEGGVYMVDPSEGRIARLFSFAEEDGMDVRTLWDRHRMRVLRVDETGSVLSWRAI